MTDRITIRRPDDWHVHLRDADPGWIHRSVGRGIVDFAAVVRALAAVGYAGCLALELETRDLRDDERPAATAAATATIAGLLTEAGMDQPVGIGGVEHG